MFVGIAEAVGFAGFLCKGFDHADAGNGVGQDVGQLRPHAVNFLETRAQFVAHGMDQPHDERQRQQGGGGQLGVDADQDGGGHHNHQHVGGKVEQVQGQKHANAVGFRANSVHQVARAAAPKVFERQAHQVLISGGAQICANALRHQGQNVGFEPAQAPCQQSCAEQTTQVQIDQIVVNVFAVLEGNEHIIHQRHRQVRRHQGGGGGSERQHKARQQTPLVRLGKTPQTKQPPGGQRRVLLAVAHGALVADVVELEFALWATRLRSGSQRFTVGQ